MKPLFYSFFALFLSFGCAGPRTLFLRVDLAPDVSPPPLPAGKSVSVTLAPFTDVRGETVSLGTRTRYEGVVDTYAPDWNLTEAVTDAAETWLKKSGYTVERVRTWDRTSTSVKDFSTDFVIVGTIDKFLVETKSAFAKTTTRVVCGLTVVIGKTHDSSLNTQKMETTSENQSPFFSIESVEDTVSDALTQALTRALKPLP